MIRKKLVRKTLDMIKKIADEKYNDTFWKEFGTNIKLGVIEDHSNRTRLAKLLRFQSSHHPSDITSLDQYVERMKEKQDKIYFMAGSNRKEVRWTWQGSCLWLGIYITANLRKRGKFNCNCELELLTGFTSLVTDGKVAYIICTCKIGLSVVLCKHSY